MILISEHYNVSLDYLCKGEGGSNLLETLNKYVTLDYHDISGVTDNDTVYPLPTLSINRAYFEYLIQTANAKADKNIPEHAELAEEGWVYNTGRQAKFTTEEFEKLAADLFEKNGLSYEPEVFLAEAVTGSGFVIIARHVNEDGTTKDMHIVEIARSGNFDENGPEDEFDVTKDDVIRPADYTLSLDEAGSETQEKVVETTIPAENN